MNKLAFLGILFFLLSCTTSDKKNQIILGDFDVTPIPFTIDQNGAIQQLDQLINTYSGDRNADGSLKQENALPLLGSLLGYYQQFPLDEIALDKGFRVAELLSFAKDHQNAAKVFQLLTHKFPQSEKVGHAQLQLGMLLDRQLQQKDMAIIAYRSFLKNFPKHPLRGTGEGFLYELLR